MQKFKTSSVWNGGRAGACFDLDALLLLQGTDHEGLPPKQQPSNQTNTPHAMKTWQRDVLAGHRRNFRRMVVSAKLSGMVINSRGNSLACVDLLYREISLEHCCQPCKESRYGRYRFCYPAFPANISSQAGSQLAQMRNVASCTLKSAVG